MNNETLQALTELAQKMGTTTEYLWSILIAQARIDGYFYLIGALTAWVISVLFFKESRRFWMKLRSLDGSYKLDATMYAWICGIAGVAGCGAVIGFVHSAITCFYNPGYTALTKILESIK